MDKGFYQGIFLTFILALVANQIAQLPLFSMMGIMIISIFLGFIWKQLMDVPLKSTTGITFSSKFLLRAGIILMGLRINLAQIIEAGVSVILIDSFVVLFTITSILLLGRALGLEKRLTALLAVGTAICGAAAIVALAPIINAKKEQTVLSITCISVIGTLGTFTYVFLFPLIGDDAYWYGLLAGATLQELAHVLAAAVPGGTVSEEAALLVKLGRVALLLPVALLFGLFYTKHTSATPKQNKRLRDLPIPWFLFGFLACSIFNTLGLLPSQVIQPLINLSVILLSMSMAGLGLTINLKEFKQAGIKPVLVGLLGFIALVLVAPWLLTLR